jgi:hypothetical protein
MLAEYVATTDTFAFSDLVDFATDMFQRNETKEDLEAIVMAI